MYTENEGPFAGVVGGNLLDSGSLVELWVCLCGTRVLFQCSVSCALSICCAMWKLYLIKFKVTSASQWTIICVV